MVHKSIKFLKLLYLPVILVGAIIGSQVNAAEPASRTSAVSAGSGADVCDGVLTKTGNVPDEPSICVFDSSHLAIIRRDAAAIVATMSQCCPTLETFSATHERVIFDSKANAVIFVRVAADGKREVIGLTATSQ